MTAGPANPAGSQWRSRLPPFVATAGGVFFLAFGLWAMVAPESFFAAVATFEPYNRHIIQDVGAFQIGLGAVLMLAVSPVGADGLAVALLGVGAGGAAHVIAHVVGRDLGGNPAVDIPFLGVLSALLLVAGVVRWQQHPARARKRGGQG